MTSLTCIYIGADGEECGETPDTLVALSPELDQRRAAYGELVLMQEHLRDDHLYCSTDVLQHELRRVKRWVYRDGDANPIIVGPEQPWDANKYEPYTKIEYVLNDADQWLRSVPNAD